MGSIPKQKVPKYNSYRINSNEGKLKNDKTIKFSFELLEFNKYFNLDGTCVNWTRDLFEVLKEVSKLEEKELRAGGFSGRNSTLRVHDHRKANPPCNLPPNVDLEEFCQIRISRDKGGIHGIFVNNVFYIIWIDPQHNLYPDKKHGGLKVIKPPSTCCKERDYELKVLNEKIEQMKEERDQYLEIATMYEKEIAAMKAP